MKLIHNWKSVAARSHSMWAIYLGIACLLLPEALHWWLGYDIASPRLWWFLALALLIYGAIGRVKDQGIDK